MDYSRFRFRSDIDWIEIEIETSRHTLGCRLKNCSGFSYVEPCNPVTREPYPHYKRNTYTTLFRIIDQDPQNFRLILKKLEAVNKVNPIASSPKVVGIEVAFDAYGKGATSVEMVELAAHLYKFLTEPVSENQRLYRTCLDKVEDILCFNPLMCSLADGYQIGIGDKWDDLYMHIYFKTTDSVRDGVALTLPFDQQRARFEITLRGAALPFQRLSEWENFDFRSLTRHFNFRMFKPVLNKYAASALEIRAKQTGRLTKEQRKNYRTRREFSFATLADKKLNDIAKGSLRRLSDRW